MIFPSLLLVLSISVIVVLETPYNVVGCKRRQHLPKTENNDVNTIFYTLYSIYQIHGILGTISLIFLKTRVQTYRRHLPACSVTDLGFEKNFLFPMWFVLKGMIVSTGNGGSFQ